MDTELKEVEAERRDEKTYEYGGAKIHIRREEDDGMESPREWCNSWKWYSNCNRHVFDREDGEWLSVRDIFDGEAEKGETVRDAILRQHPEFLDVRYIFLMDHSGIYVSLGMFSDKWDSGIGAYAVITREQAEKDCPKLKGDDEALKSEAYKWLEDEVKTYQQFLDGDVYGYVIEDSSGDEGESCWGYYDMEDCLNDAKAAVSVKDMTMRKLLDKELAAAFSETTGTFCDYVLWVHDTGGDWPKTVGLVFMSKSGKTYPDGVVADGRWFDAQTLAGMFGYQKGEFAGEALQCWNETEEGDHE